MLARPSGNILGEATTGGGNILNEAMRHMGAPIRWCDRDTRRHSRLRDDQDENLRVGTVNDLERGRQSSDAVSNMERHLIHDLYRKRVQSLALPCIAGFGALLFAARIGDANGMPVWSLQVIGLLVGVGAFCAMSRLFKCPGCKMNLMWHMMLKGPIGNWLEGSLALRCCPKCGFSEKDSAAHSRRT
jgi:hypothetical protein